MFSYHMMKNILPHVLERIARRAEKQVTIFILFIAEETVENSQHHYYSSFA